MANSHTLGTDFSPRMWRADIQVPSTVDMNSWAISACIPGPFYPLSDGLPFQTTPDHYDLLSHLLELSFSQSSGYAIALTTCQPCLAHLRAPPGPLFGGDRPSQTTHQALSVIPIQGPTLEHQNYKGGISRTTPPHLATRFSKSPTYPTHVGSMFSAEAVVKVHGVFPSSRGYTASSAAISISLSLGWNRPLAIITPFGRRSEHPTKEFHTLGPL